MVFCVVFVFVCRIVGKRIIIIILYCELCISSGSEMRRIRYIGVQLYTIMVLLSLY